jgi:hypothetical protein
MTKIQHPYGFKVHIRVAKKAMLHAFNTKIYLSIYIYVDASLLHNQKTKFHMSLENEIAQACWYGPVIVVFYTTLFMMA